MELTSNHRMRSSITHTVPYKNARIALCTGGASAVLASIWCIGPFLLVTLGFSSAKILYLLTLADWSRPFFILIAVASLLFSYNSIWGPTARTESGSCTTQKEVMVYKTYFLFVVSLVVTVLMLPHFAPGIE